MMEEVQDMAEVVLRAPNAHSQVHTSHKKKRNTIYRIIKQPAYFKGP